MPRSRPQSRLGRYESTTLGGEAAHGFVPPPLPPIPPIDVSSLLVPLQRAQMALVRLSLNWAEQAKMHPTRRAGW